jgi:microcystin-dependent protein
MTRALYAAVKSGERLVATDITDLTFFPVGSILMMDSGWTDGRGGWYICDGRNTPHGKTPDLKDKFIRGGTSSGAIGGSDTGSAKVALTAENLPAHSHPLSGTTLTTSNESQGHTHTVTAAGNITGSGIHNHSISDPGHKHGAVIEHDESKNGYFTLGGGGSRTTYYTESAQTGVAVKPAEGTHEHSFTGSQVTSGGTNVTHTHTLALSGSTGNSTGSSSVSIPVSVDTVPAYYTVIYIKKMA